MGDRFGIIILGIFILVLAAAACQPPPQTPVISLGVTTGGTDEPAIAHLEPMETHTYHAASVLVAHHAATRGDIERAAHEYTRALIADPDNITLLKRSFRALYLNGQIESAAAIASTLEQHGTPITLGSEPMAAITAKAGDWDGLEALARHLNADAASRPLAIILEAWALAFQGQGDAGLSRLHDLNAPENAPENTSESAPQSAATLHIIHSQSALMLDYLGRHEDAMAAGREAAQHPGLDSAAILDMASLLGRGGAIDEARRLIEERLDTPFSKQKISADLAAGVSTLMQTPDEAERLTAAIVAVMMLDPGGHIDILARLHLGGWISPESNLLRYHLGISLGRVGRGEEGLRIHRHIPPESPWYQPAMLAMALHYSRADDDFDKAAALFRQLLQDDPQNPDLWHYFGNAARRGGANEEALEYYGRALAYGGNQGRLEYRRGIILDRLGREAATEAALRRAASLNKSDAHVLNYLGYWLLEHGGNPGEALEMIRRATEAEPRNGYFVDSLGWAYYRLGQYGRAVQVLERAVMLRPSDPLIIDHLGDAYHKMGRVREAIYQWHHALKAAGYDANGAGGDGTGGDETGGHPDLDPDRIRAKIAAAHAEAAP